MGDLKKILPGVMRGEVPVSLSDAINDLRKFDPVDAAEKVVGNFGSPDSAEDLKKGAMGLAVLLQVRKSQEENALMEMTGDTGFDTPVSKFIKILELEGFKKALELPFTVRNQWYREGGEDPEFYHDTFYVFWHSDGLLVSFDTYGSSYKEDPSVNSAKLVFNWKPNSREDRFKVHHMSGGYAFPPRPGNTFSGKRGKRSNSLFNKYAVVAGYIDVRGGFRHTLKELRRYGSFLPKWVEWPHRWLLHYGDTRDERGESRGYFSYDSNAISMARIRQMPAEVQEMVDCPQWVQFHPENSREKAKRMRSGKSYLRRSSKKKRGNRASRRQEFLAMRGWKRKWLRRRKALGK